MLVAVEGPDTSMTTLRHGDNQPNTPRICLAFYSSRCAVHMLFYLILKQPYMAGILSLFVGVRDRG